ncbi:hypothetical protein HYV12_03470 [Candidatus Dojkabacteria bacterium]|nr:hypothetical protein [Candidatus Dojkabacteria bacterium]
MNPTNEVSPMPDVTPGPIVVETPVHRSATKKNGLIILLVITTLLGLGAAGYMYMNSKVVKKECDNKCEETVKEVIVEKKVALPVTKVGWVMVANSQCNAGMQIPDRNTVYVDGELSRTWRASNRQREEGDVNPLMGKMRNLFSVSLLSDDDASGFIPGLVTVQCGDNKDKYTLATLITDYKKYLDEQNIQMTEFGGVKYTDKGAVTMWGKTVQKINVEYNTAVDASKYDAYLYVTDEHIYLVSSLSHSTNDKVKADLGTIFNSLVFFD